MLNTQQGQVNAADGTAILFETHGSRTSPAVFLGPHFYRTRERRDESCTVSWIEALESEFFLIIADYPRGIGSTGNPQRLSYSAEVAAREYELIADAAGVHRFAWVGYSFGGAIGVQLACRTDRVSALAIGGFPPLNAPFKRVAQLAREMALTPPPVPESWDVGVLWSTVAFYESLLSWPERAAVAALKMPRLVYMGEFDDGLGPRGEIPLARNLHLVEDELRSLAWQVVWLAGLDHLTALQPTYSLRYVHQFLRGALLV
jgi:pimeloyl-ACP methyl ester carboxylesterase